MTPAGIVPCVRPVLMAVVMAGVSSTALAQNNAPARQGTVERVPERIEQAVLPFFSEHLSFTASR